MPTKLKTPEVLDRIVDRVLAYRPKAATPKAKKRKRKAAKHGKVRNSQGSSVPGLQAAD
jgi:hypothetical protein